MTQIKNIILDFGGVIIDLNLNKTREAFHKLGINSISETLQKAIFDFESGLINEQTLHHALSSSTISDVNTTDLNNAWCQLLRDLPQHRVDFLSDLGNKYPLYLLSNTNSIHIDYLRKRENSKFDKFENAFSKVYYSYQMQTRKPSSNIFQKVIDELNINPEETLFVDDMSDNIETAKKLGFQTWLFDVEKDEIINIEEFIQNSIFEIETINNKV
jgi:putative hydrolase of the HAD superfamily